MFLSPFFGEKCSWEYINKQSYWIISGNIFHFCMYDAKLKRKWNDSILVFFLSICG
jgi:hypothetical protein